MSTEDFVVVKGSGRSLLGWEASQRLTLLSCVQTIKTSIEKIVNRFDHLFQGIGKIKEFQVKLHTDKSVKHVVQSWR